MSLMLLGSGGTDRAAGAGGSAFNPSDKSANITLSNSDRTATTTSASDGGVRSTSSKTSGKVYAEFTVISINGGDTGFGITLASSTLSAIGSVAASSLLAFFSGNIWYNGSSTGFSVGAIGPGDVISLALDVPNQKAWLRRNAGAWSNSGDPATNTGGHSVTIFSGSAAAYLVMCANFSGVSATLNTAGGFAQSLPSGFVAWG